MGAKAADAAGWSCPSNGGAAEDSGASAARGAAVLDDGGFKAGKAERGAVAKPLRDSY